MRQRIGARCASWSLMWWLRPIHCCEWDKLSIRDVANVAADRRDVRHVWKGQAVMGQAQMGQAYALFPWCDDEYSFTQWWARLSIRAVGFIFCLDVLRWFPMLALPVVWGQKTLWWWARLSKWQYTVLRCSRLIFYAIIACLDTDTARKTHWLSWPAWPSNRECCCLCHMARVTQSCNLHLHLQCLGHFFYSLLPPFLHYTSGHSRCYAPPTRSSQAYTQFVANPYPCIQHNFRIHSQISLVSSMVLSCQCFA